MSSYCRSCGAEITWVVTVYGKNMPVDADPAEDGNLYLLPGDPPIAVLSTFWRDGLFPRGANPTYISHFATCKDAREWRKGEEK